jgi:hypothetical protein
MKHYLYSLLAVIILTVGLSQGTSAKRTVVPQMYMFGFAASFNDTIVYFTDIQQVDSAWIESKSKLLQSRDIYSAQLRSHLSLKKQLDNRTCVVFYNTNREKLEKKFIKMRRLYGKGKDGQDHFDVRFLEAGEFQFKPIDLSELDAAEQAIEEDVKPEKKTKKAKRKSGK